MSPRLIPPPQTPAIPPALDNVDTLWQGILAAVGLDVIFLSVEAGLDSPVWRHGDLGPILGATLEEFAAGRLDGSYFAHGRQFHFFYVRKLEVALRALSEGLRRLGLLDLATLCYTGRTCPFWSTYVPTNSGGFLP